MISAVTPFLEKAEEKRRSVCLLTSISASQAQWHRWTYGATKGALWSLVRHATLELGEKGIRVNSERKGLMKDINPSGNKLSLSSRIFVLKNIIRRYILLRISIQFTAIF